jgi:hypothetical protein
MRPPSLFFQRLFSLQREELTADSFKAAPVFTKIRITKARSGADVDDLIRPIQQKLAIIDKEYRPQFNPQIIGQIIHDNGIAPACKDPFQASKSCTGITAEYQRRYAVAFVCSLTRNTVGRTRTRGENPLPGAQVFGTLTGTTD